MEREQATGRGVGRRAVVAAGLLAGGAGLLWVGREALGPLRDVWDEIEDAPRRVGPRPSPTAVAASDLPTHRHLGGARLVYEIDGRATTLRIEPGFAARLDASLRSHWRAAGWATPARLTSYGTWIAAEGDATSWHHAGRAFDVGRVRSADGTHLASCRYDLWRTTSGASRRAAERAYWALAATLHRDFAFVLTYLFDEAHHSHIHVDDGLSGDGRSSFDRGSRVQVHALQAMCRHIWGHDLSITGRWDGPTREATGAVLDRIGVGGRLASDDGWRAFLTATARRG